MRIFQVCSILLMIAASVAASAADEDWAAAMKAVHVKGGALRGSVSQIGDSITYTKAFLAGMAWGEPKGDEWKAVNARINGKLLNDRKGAEHCNYSGWTSGDGAGKIKGVIAAEKPEIAVIMYGTNDANKGTSPAAYEQNMNAIVDACLQAGCIPIMSTIPPILNKDAKVGELNAIVKKIAAGKKVPWVDFHAEILARQPGTGWDGTLLGKGDVHPSGGNNFDFTEGNLKVCGYALRNYITIKAMKDVIEKCF